MKLKKVLAILTIISLVLLGTGHMGYKEVIL